jgi:hypothetical protein
MYAAQFGAADPTAAAAALAAQQHAFAQQHAAQAALQQCLRNFWMGQAAEMEGTTDFKNHNLPLARIKKIMKSDEDVRMISSEAPALFAKACEMFILEARAPSRPRACSQPRSHASAPRPGCFAVRRHSARGPFLLQTLSLGRERSLLLRVARCGSRPHGAPFVAHAGRTRRRRS